MKTYETPAVEVINVVVDDIITTSGRPNEFPDA